MSKAFDNLMKKAFNEDINVTRSQADSYFKAISKHFNGDGSYKINGKHDVTINTKDFGDIQLGFTEGKDMKSLKVDSVTVNGKTEKVSKEINSIKDVPSLFQGMDILFGGRVKGSKSGSSSSNGKKYKPETKEELKKLCDDLSINLGDIDTSLITDMKKLFRKSMRTNEQFKGIETWDVSNVENMSEMFWGADFNQPIGNWNVSNVKNMGSVFHDATSFNQPLDKWNVSNVENMGYMFFEAESFNQPLDNWDVSNVEDMASMFSHAKSFNQPLNSWNTSNVKSMRGMFEKARSFNQPLNKWDVSNVEDIDEMFYYATSFNQDLSSWDVSKAGYPWDAFMGCPMKREYTPDFGGTRKKKKASNNNEEPKTSSNNEKSSNNEGWVEIRYCCVGTIIDPNTTPSLQVILDLLNQKDLGFHFTKENTRGGGLSWYPFIAGGYKALVFGFNKGVEIRSDEETAENISKKLLSMFDRAHTRVIKIRDEEDLIRALAELSGDLVEGETLSGYDVEFDGDEDDAEKFSKVIGIPADTLMEKKYAGLSYLINENPDFHPVSESFKFYSNSIFGRILGRM